MVPRRRLRGGFEYPSGQKRRIVGAQDDRQRNYGYSAREPCTACRFLSRQKAHAHPFRRVGKQYAVCLDLLRYRACVLPRIHAHEHDKLSHTRRRQPGVGYDFDPIGRGGEYRARRNFHFRVQVGNGGRGVGDRNRTGDIAYSRRGLSRVRHENL